MCMPLGGCTNVLLHLLSQTCILIRPARSTESIVSMSAWILTDQRLQYMRSEARCQARFNSVAANWAQLDRLGRQSCAASAAEHQMTTWHQHHLAQCAHAHYTLCQLFVLQ